MQAKTSYRLLIVEHEIDTGTLIKDAAEDDRFDVCTCP